MKKYIETKQVIELLSCGKYQDQAEGDVYKFATTIIREINRKPAISFKKLFKKCIKC